MENRTRIALNSTSYNVRTYLYGVLYEDFTVLLVEISEIISICAYSDKPVYNVGTFGMAAMIDDGSVGGKSTGEDLMGTLPAEKQEALANEFGKLQFSAPFEPLQIHVDSKERFFCCETSNSIYCKKCLRVNKTVRRESGSGDNTTSLLPTTRLPVKLDVIHHPRESISRSTAIHSVVLSPIDARILEWNDLVAIEVFTEAEKIGVYGQASQKDCSAEIDATAVATFNANYKPPQEELTGKRLRHYKAKVRREARKIGIPSPSWAKAIPNIVKSSANIPDYTNEDGYEEGDVVLLYPSDTSRSISSYDMRQLKRLVVIDAT